MSPHPAIEKRAFERDGYISRNVKLRRSLSSRGAKNRLSKGRNWTKCHWCQARIHRDVITLDHVRALSRGGYDKTKQCVLACRECNAAKGRMPAGTFVLQLRAKKTPIKANIK